MQGLKFRRKNILTNSFFVCYLPIKEKFMKRTHIARNTYPFDKCEKYSAVLTACLNLSFSLTIITHMEYEIHEFFLSSEHLHQRVVRDI